MRSRKHACDFQVQASDEPSTGDEVIVCVCVCVGGVGVLSGEDVKSGFFQLQMQRTSVSKKRLKEWFP